MTVQTLRKQTVDAINNVQPTVVKKDGKTAIENALELKSRNRSNA